MSPVIRKVSGLGDSNPVSWRSSSTRRCAYGAGNGRPHTVAADSVSTGAVGRLNLEAGILLCRNLTRCQRKLIANKGDFILNERAVELSV